MLTEITRELLYEDYLQEDKDVERKRNYYINLMKILKSCEKLMQYDDE
jgi:hypothetical protein